MPLVEFVIDPTGALALVPKACDVAESGAEFGEEGGVTYRSGRQVVAHPLRVPLATKDDFLRWP